jgi:cbb3-type cytochrome oxidase maturation protein
MNGIALIIASALIVGLGSLLLLLWALASGQYEDLEGAAARILIDEPEKD